MEASQTVPTPSPRKGVPLAQPFILGEGAERPIREKEQESRLAGLYDLNISPDVGLNARSFLPFPLICAPASSTELLDTRVYPFNQF